MSDDLIEGYVPQEHEKNIVNPFLANGVFNAIRTYAKHKLYNEDDLRKDSEFILGNNDDGTLATGSNEYKYEYFFDPVKSCRVFQTKSERKKIMSLDNNALKLFMCIVYHLGNNVERIRITKKKYTQEMGISSKTLYTALKILRDANILAIYKTDIYWINPFVLYNGNRIKQYKEHITVIKTIKYKE